MFSDQIILTDGTTNHVYDLRGRMVLGPAKLRAERQVSEFDDTPERLIMAHEQTGQVQKSLIALSAVEKDALGKIAEGKVQVTITGTKGINTATVMKGLVKQMAVLLGTAGYDQKWLNAET